MARSRRWGALAMVFVPLVGGGVGAFHLMGGFGRRDAQFNMLLLVVGSFLVAYGFRAVRYPTLLRRIRMLTPERVEDDGPTSPDEGRRAGVLCLVVGALLFLAGIFKGSG